VGWIDARLVLVALAAMLSKPDLGRGLRPAYHGPDKQDLVDIVLPLWFTLAQLRGQRHLAFRILQD
jgi:hypothetical protein